jgi:exopolysaccharide production protein ExoQ
LSVGVTETSRPLFLARQSQALISQKASFEWAIWLVLAGSAFFGQLAIAEGDQLMTVALDRTVIFKLCCSTGAFGLGILGVLWIQQVRWILTSIPSLLLLLIYLFAVVASVSAVANNALPCALIGIGYIMFVATAIVALGFNSMVMAITTGLVFYVLGGWYLYFFMPSYGVFPELLDDGLIVSRMGGMNHPNGFARQAAIGLLLSLYLHRSRQLKHWMFIILLVTLFGGALYLARSRTAIVACFLAVVVLYRDRLLTPKALLISLLGAFLAVGSLFVAIGVDKGDNLDTKLVKLVAKSGNPEELMSGTGRTKIWARAIEVIMQKPIQGNGFGSAPILMVDNNQSTHNMLLHTLMVSGFGGGMALVCLIAWKLMFAASHPNILVSALVALIIIAGCMEDTILETFPGACNMLWVACCFAPVIPLHIFHKSKNTTGGTNHANSAAVSPA